MKKWVPVALCSICVLIPLFGLLVYTGQFESGDTAFTRYSKLEFTSGYADEDTDGNYTIKLGVRNTGSAAFTITGLFINGKEWNTVDDTISENLTGIHMDPGERAFGVIRLRRTSFGAWTSGMLVEVTVETGVRVAWQWERVRTNEVIKQLSLPWLNGMNITLDDRARVFLSLWALPSRFMPLDVKLLVYHEYEKVVVLP